MSIFPKAIVDKALSYNLVDLTFKVKKLTKPTLCLKYCRDIVIVVTKGENRNQN